MPISAGPWVWRYGSIRAHDGSEVIGAESRDGQRWVTCEGENRALVLLAPDLLDLARIVASRCTGCRGEDNSGRHWTGDPALDDGEHEVACPTWTALSLIARIEGTAL